MSAELNLPLMAPEFRSVWREGTSGSHGQRVQRGAEMGNRQREVGVDRGNPNWRVA